MSRNKPLDSPPVLPHAEKRFFCAVQDLGEAQFGAVVFVRKSCFEIRPG